MTGAGATGELESVRVTRILRDDIVLGRRVPGSRLVERDIAAELDVSRLPVREAIRTLVSVTCTNESSLRRRSGTPR